MIGAPTRVIQLAKEKSQQIIASKSEKFSYKIEKFLTVYQGYNQIKPKVFPKRLATMFSTDVVVATEDKRDYFGNNQQSTLAATSSLRRHQRERGLREGDIDTSSKIRIVLPETNRPTSPSPTLTLRSLVAPRTRRATNGPKTPTRIVLTNPERGNEAILCSSVVLTYQEGLFRHDKDMVRRDSEV